MTDAGFFRGTSAEQDNRFSDKHKKLLKQMKFSDNLNLKVDTKKVHLDILRPWVTRKITEILGMEDEVVVEFIFNQLEAERYPDGKTMQINLTGFLNGKNAREFMGELWSLLSSAQNSPSGIPQQLVEEKKEQILAREATTGDLTNGAHRVSAVLKAMDQKIEEERRKVNEAEEERRKEGRSQRLLQEEERRKEGRSQRLLEEERRKEGKSQRSPDRKTPDRRRRSRSRSRSRSGERKRRSRSREKGERRRRSSDRHRRRSKSPGGMSENRFREDRERFREERGRFREEKVREEKGRFREEKVREDRRKVPREEYHSRSRYSPQRRRGWDDSRGRSPRQERRLDGSLEAKRTFTERSPDRKERSPGQKERSPGEKERSPGEKEGSPGGKKRSLSPVAKERSFLRSPVSEKKEESPRLVPSPSAPLSPPCVRSQVETSDPIVEECSRSGSPSKSVSPKVRKRIKREESESSEETSSSEDSSSRSSFSTPEKRPEKNRGQKSTPEKRPEKNRGQKSTPEKRPEKSQKSRIRKSSSRHRKSSKKSDRKRSGKSSKKSRKRSPSSSSSSSGSESDSSSGESSSTSGSDSSEDSSKLRRKALKSLKKRE